MSDLSEPALIGLGTTLSYKTAAGVVVTIGTIQDLDGPGITVGEVEAARLNSTFKPYLPTLPEGEASFTVQHLNTDSGCVALRAMIVKAPIPTVTWTLTYPDGFSDVFPGFCKGYEIQGIENETVITASVSIRMTGAPTLVAPTQNQGS